MSEDPPRLAPLGDPRLPVFDLLEHAVWITDVDQGRIVWANTPALELWRARDLDELVNREPNLSETALTTLRHVRARVAGGTRVRSDRTMYPRGVPTLLEVVVSAFSLPDGRVALLVEGQPKRGAPIDPDVLRGAEAVRYAPLLVSTHDARARRSPATPRRRAPSGATTPCCAPSRTRRRVAPSWRRPSLRENSLATRSWPRSGDRVGTRSRCGASRTPSRATPRSW